MGDREDAGYEAQIAGDLGEVELARLAAAAGLNAVRAAPDRTGWDFCLEPLSTPRGPALDLAPAAFRWMVQVKAVQGNKTPIPITLENWQRMVKESLPWFVFVVELDGRRVRACYLVHVGEALIFNALKRLRRASGPKPNLNKKTMSLPWDGGDRLEPLDGESLRNRLHKATGLDPDAYTRWKQHVVRTVGYGPERDRVRLEVERSSLQELAEFVVGARDSLHAKSLHLEENIRFGMPLKVTRIGPGVFKGPPAPSMATCTVTLTDQSGGLLSSLSFDARHAAAALPGLPEEHDLLTLSRPHLRLTIRTGRPTLNMQLGIDEFASPQRLGDFGPAAEFAAHLIRRREDDLRIRVHSAGGEPLELGMGDVGFGNKVLRSYIQAMADGWWLCTRAGVSEDARVAPDVFASQNMDLFNLRAALSGSPLNWSGTDTDAVELEPGPTGAIDFKFVDLGEVVIAAALTIVGDAKLSRQDGQTTVTVTDGRVAIEQEVVRTRTSMEQQRKSIEAEWRAKAEGWLKARGAVNCFLMRGDDPSGEC
ncbi:MAG: hypothetical protein WCC48_10830 [Anaeromyxobacteraceae bacterium]